MYVELHARSAFSFLEGASLPEALVATGGNLNMPAMALLDRDGVFGSPRFHMAAKKIGLKAHIGAEVSCECFLPSQQKVWGVVSYTHLDVYKRQALRYGALPPCRHWPGPPPADLPRRR